VQLNAISRCTGIPQLYSFYRHFSFNAPRFTTGSGVLLLLGIGAIRLYLALTGIPPESGGSALHYLIAYFALVVAVSVAASVGMLLIRTPVVVKASWGAGSLLAVATLVMYLVSRTAGLPGIEGFIGRWDYPLGTFAIILSVSFLGLHGSVLTGLNIAMSWRSWHD